MKVSGGPAIPVGWAGMGGQVARFRNDQGLAGVRGRLGSGLAGIRAGWGQGGGMLAGTSAHGHDSLGPLTLGSSCSTTCRCRNPHSVGNAGVRKTSDSPSSPVQACSLLTQAEPWSSTHPLHKALCNAPCTAAALQVLQELTVGRGKGEGPPSPPAPHSGGLQEAGDLVAARISQGGIMSRGRVL